MTVCDLSTTRWFVFRFWQNYRNILTDNLVQMSVPVERLGSSLFLTHIEANMTAVWEPVAEYEKESQTSRIFKEAEVQRSMPSEYSVSLCSHWKFAWRPQCKYNLEWSWQRKCGLTFEMLEVWDWTSKSTKFPIHRFYKYYTSVLNSTSLNVDRDSLRHLIRSSSLGEAIARHICYIPAKRHPCGRRHHTVPFSTSPQDEDVK